MTLSSEDLIFSVGILDESYQILNDPTIFTLVPSYELTKTIDGEFINTVIPLRTINCTEMNQKDVFHIWV